MNVEAEDRPVLNDENAFHGMFWLGAALVIGILLGRRLRRGNAETVPPDRRWPRVRAALTTLDMGRHLRELAADDRLPGTERVAVLRDWLHLATDLSRLLEQAEAQHAPDARALRTLRQDLDAARQDGEKALHQMGESPWRS